MTYSNVSSWSFFIWFLIDSKLSSSYLILSSKFSTFFYRVLSTSSGISRESAMLAYQLAIFSFFFLRSSIECWVRLLNSVSYCLMKEASSEISVKFAWSLILSSHSLSLGKQRSTKDEMSSSFYLIISWEVYEGSILIARISS